MFATSTGSRQKSATRDGRGSALFTLLLLVCLLFTLAACGSDEAATETTATVGSEEAPGGGTDAMAATTAGDAAGAMSADELGAEIGAVYVEALAKVTTALDGGPEVATVKDQVQQLKDGYVKRLVVLGAAREALSTSDRAKVDSKIVAALEAVGSEPWYADYNAAWQKYSAQDSEFGNLIAAFNVIGQYANYELLKQQLPEEAARLGIE